MKKEKKLQKATPRLASILKEKAIFAIAKSFSSFNNIEISDRKQNVFRITNSLLLAQHASEMLIKAVLVKKKVEFIDPEQNKSMNFDGCLGFAKKQGVSDEEKNAIKAVDSLRNAAQHWILDVEEGLVYINLAALVRVFDDILNRFFKERLADHLPERILPISTQPIAAPELLIDQTYSQIQELLTQGTKKPEKVEGMIRGLQAMMHHVGEDPDLTPQAYEKILKKIKSGAALEQVFPPLSELKAAIYGTGFNVVVKIDRAEGVPVQLSKDNNGALMVHQVDQRKTHPHSHTDIVKKTGLSRYEIIALLDAMGAKNDPQLVFEVKNGESTSFFKYSEKLLQQLISAKSDQNFNARLVEAKKKFNEKNMAKRKENKEREKRKDEQKKMARKKVLG